MSRDAGGGERTSGPLWASGAGVHAPTQDDHKGPHSTLHRPRPYDLSMRLRASSCQQNQEQTAA